MEKILNLQRGWKSRLWFGEKAFALCFVIFTAFTGLVSVNAGPGALYESHTFRTILNVMLTAAAYVIAIDLVYNMTQGGPNHRTEVLATELYAEGFNYFKYGYASAISVVLLVMCLIVTLLVKKVIKVETYEG